MNPTTSPTSRTRARRAGLHALALHALACALLLTSTAGCGILPERSELRLFDPQPQILVDAALPKVDWQLAIPRPYADTTVDSPRILVRPAPGELQVYKGAAWTQSAPDLVQDRLLRAFADSGRLPGVSRRGDGVGADYVLLLDLRSFESDYTTNGAPQARIVIGARLLHARDKRVVASRRFESLTPARATDVASVAQAFEQGLASVGGEMLPWVLQAR